jgi:hypothetical protein
MPRHQVDLALIPILENIIVQQVQRNPNSHIILCGDFNKNILLMEHSHNFIFTPLHPLDYQWQQLMDILQCHYSTTNISYSRQDRHYYSLIKLIDRFFLKTSLYVICIFQPILVTYKTLATFWLFSQF